VRTKALIWIFVMTIVVSTVGTTYACCQSPIASFTASPANVVICQQVSFDASASYDSDGTTLTYSWDFGDGETGTGKTTTHRYRCTGTKTVKLTVTDNDNPDCCNGDPNCTDKSDSETKYITVSLPTGCSSGSKSANLQAAEIGNPDCSNPNDGGATDPPENLGINIFARYDNCKWVFQVTAVVDVRSDPCPGNYTEIADGSDPDITQANFCTLVNGFYNGGSGDGGGDCFSSGANKYGNSGCVENHEDKHFQIFYDRATGYEENVLLSKSSMNDIIIDCSNSNTTTCQAAKSARQAAIESDVDEAFDNAWTYTVAQGEPPAWAAEFPCAENLAKSICQRAKDEPTWDVDTCAQCVTWGYTD
jgi:hypothetical protein